MTISDFAKDDENDEKFYARFKKNYLPSFEFFKLFFAWSALRGIATTKTDSLYKNLHKLKKESQDRDIFQDIHFYYNGVDHSSSDIEPNITTLQALGSLGLANPDYENIINYMNNETAHKIIDHSPYSDRMKKVVDDFIKLSDA
jgi:hypothetical protein